MRVKLYDRRGVYVATAHVPPFDPAPEVILFGSRTFVRDVTSVVEPDDTVSHRYVEGLLITVDPRTGMTRSETGS